MARLKFFARGIALVTDVDAQERGLRRFIARRWQEVQPGRWAWVPAEKPQEVESHPDLLRACRDGDLWAADEATAKACGVSFDPLFGEEPTETIKGFKAKKTEAKLDAEASGGKGDG